MDSTEITAGNKCSPEQVSSLRKWLGLSHRDFFDSPSEYSGDLDSESLLELVSEFDRADRLGTKLTKDGLPESDTLLAQLASSAMGALAARAKAGNESAQVLYFDAVTDAVKDFESLAFQGLQSFQKRARIRAEIPGMISRITKDTGKKNEKLLRDLNQGENCQVAPAENFESLLPEATFCKGTKTAAVAAFVNLLHDQLNSWRSAGRVLGDLVIGSIPADDYADYIFFRRVFDLPDFCVSEVDSYNELAWDWLLDAFGFDKNGTDGAEEDYLKTSGLFQVSPLNRIPGDQLSAFRFRKALREAWKAKARSVQHNTNLTD